MKAERDKACVDLKLTEEKLRGTEKKSGKLNDGWERERADMEARMTGLIKQVDRLKNDPTASKEGAKKLQDKLNEYKHKLKLSNQLIAKFSQQIGMGGVQHQPAELLGP